MAIFASPVTLIPATPQRLWGAPAVANFALGGLGAGLYLAAAAAAVLGGSPAIALAGWIGPALALAGLAAVAAEAGRPLRGARVVRRVRTSWMSREALLGGAFIALAVADALAPVPALRLLASLAAGGFVVAQGLLVRDARGVTAWAVPAMPAVFAASAATSGVGALLALEVAGGRPLTGALLGATLAILALAMVVWLGYVTWSDDEAFREATRPLREGASAVAVTGGGYVLPFALATAALVSGLAAPALVAGALMALAQVHAKWLLVVGAGRLWPIALRSLGLQRRPS